MVFAEIVANVVIFFAISHLADTFPPKATVTVPLEQSLVKLLLNSYWQMCTFVVRKIVA